jgi:hypothetical protein
VPAWQCRFSAARLFGSPASGVIPGMHNHRRLAQALIGSPSELARVAERIGDPRKAGFRATHLDRPEVFERKQPPERMGVMRWLLGPRTAPM